MQATKYVRPRLLAIASILFLSSYALIEISSSWTGGIAESFYYDQQQRRLQTDSAMPGMAAEVPEMSPGRLRRDKFLEARVKNAREAWRRQRKLTETETEEDIWLRPNLEDHAALKEEVSSAD